MTWSSSGVGKHFGGVFASRRVSWIAAVVVGLSTGMSAGTPQTKDTLSEDEKQARVASLLRQSGSDAAANAEPAVPEPGAQPEPGTLEGKKGAPTGKPAEDGSPANGPSSASAPAQNAGASPAPTPEGTPRTTVKVLSAGAEPKRQLRYGFAPGQERKFTLDLEIAPQRLQNGQPMAGVPPMALTATGTTRTDQVHEGLATRSYAFQELMPSVSGIPPEIAAQVKAEFAGLRGLQLVERVTTLGKVEALGLKESSELNPQVLALMQYLTDGMTNAFLPLPEQPVGAGAKWLATTAVESGGLTVTQENTIVITSLRGDTVTAELSYVQSAPAQEVKSPNIPPGVKVEVVKLDGSGTGRISTDLAKFTVDSKIDVAMQVDTRVTQQGAPAPLIESGLTKMRAHVRVTQ